MTTHDAIVPAIHTAFSAIDQQNPLRMPIHFSQALIGPRLDRLDAKTAYVGEYLAYLEQRIQALEARLDGR